MQNISEVRACVESNISLRFSCLFFFSLVGHLIGFILVGNVFRNAFRILRLNEREDIGGSWNKIFMEIFRSGFLFLLCA